MVVVIVGSTGLVGRELIKKLLIDQSFNKVISISRSPLGIQNSKLQEIHLQDLGQLSKLSENLKGDVYFCALGTTIKEAKSQEQFIKIDKIAVLDFASIAKRHEGKFVVISAMGASTKSKFFYNRVKGEMEQALIDLKLKSLTVFRPGLLIGDRKKVRPAEKFAIEVFKVTDYFLPSTLNKRWATKVDQLAKRMLEESKKDDLGIRFISADEI